MSCDYCGEIKDELEKGIYVSPESGGVIVQIDGIENRRNDGDRMYFCSIEHFKLAAECYSWGYGEEKCPLKDQPKK